MALLLFVLSCIIGYKTFLPIYQATEVVVPYGLNPFDIATENPTLWDVIKKIYIITFVFSHVIISVFCYRRIFCKISEYLKKCKKIKKCVKNKQDPNNTFLEPEELSLKIGIKEDILKEIYVPESGLYQNFLITGTIGSR